MTATAFAELSAEARRFREIAESRLADGDCACAEQFIELAESAEAEARNDH